MQIDLNADMGESFGPWTMGQDAAMLDIVSSANIACGGHAGDPETMVATLRLAGERAVRVGAHPGYDDKPGFGRRTIPMSAREIEHMVAVQIGALMGAAAVAGVPVAYVKAHGALANLAADEPEVAAAVAKAAAALSRDLGLLAISGTEQEAAGRAAGLQVYSEVFADRAYLASGRLVPRSRAGAMIHDADAAASRMLRFLGSGLMPTLDGGTVALAAHSICVHGDSPGAVAMAATLKQRLSAGGIRLAAFCGRIA